MNKKALYYRQKSDDRLQCELCPHHCILIEGKRGICLTRQNIGHELISLNFLRPVSMNIDPIEKKPLYHFYPGSEIFSSGPNGCTFKCLFCQNCEISQDILPVKEIPAEDFVDAIVKSNTIGIAYTYSEPYIWFETIMEVGRVIKSKGLKNVMVTNGYMEPAPLKDLLTVVDAMNIDIKSMRPEFYSKLCKAELMPVLRTCETVKKHCHLEITNLLIPGENDSTDDVSDLVKFVAENLGPDTPLHFSRYFPRYKMTAPPTDEKILLGALEIARGSLQYVYAGNVQSDAGSNTYCPSCRETLVKRRGYLIETAPGLEARGSDKTAACPKCGFETNILVVK
jgi:pyruvate formate lyase activating enzyme